MSRMICTASPKVKPARRTARPSAPFGSGLFRFVAFAVTAAGYAEPSDADRAAAATMFTGEPDYDQLAGEAAYLDSCAALTPPPVEVCRSCGELAEISRAGYCDACDDAGTEATIAGVNGRAGLGYRVF